MLFLLLAVGGCAADLLSKRAVFAWLGLPPDGPVLTNTYWIWEPYIGVQTAVNQGALFGMGQGLSIWFAGLSVLAAAGIVYWLFVRRAAHDLFLTITLGMVSAGILGNLYDRLGLWHGVEIQERFRNGVRDWILFQYPPYTWPNFNLADSLLVCGAALLMWHAFFQSNPDSKPIPSPAASPNAVSKESAS
ncbi:MAG: signal peptidase II [Pirellulaceae bacterium]